MELSKPYLQQLLSDQIEESGTLEYKAAPSLDRTNEAKREITKDVSAFANAAGGLLIYGIREFADAERRHLPEKFDPIDQKRFSREWLEQVTSLIQPRIGDLRIVPIHVGPGTNHYAYAIEVPADGTAHQCLDGRYYRRRNFESTYMEDYEIRDVMNRKKHPVITVEVRIAIRERDDSFVLLRVTNTSRVLARNYRVVLEIPIKCSVGFVAVENATIEAHGAERCWQIVFWNSLRGPLFPNCTLIHKEKLKLGMTIKKRDSDEPHESTKVITVSVHADEMQRLDLTKDPVAAEKDWT